LSARRHSGFEQYFWFGVFAPLSSSLALQLLNRQSRIDPVGRLDQVLQLIGRQMTERASRQMDDRRGAGRILDSSSGWRGCCSIWRSECDGPLGPPERRTLPG
jgi:hypothetical protein